MKKIDIHIYYGRWHHPISLHTVEDTFEVMDRHDIEKAVLMSAKSLCYDYREGNRDLFADIADQPRLYGFVVVNLHYPKESVEEIRRYADRPQYRGIKIHPSCTQISIAEGYDKALFDLVEALGKPVLLHTSNTKFTTPTICVPIAKRHPTLPFVLGHMGRPDWQNGIQAAEEAENIYLDPSCSFPDAPKIDESVRRVGAEKVVFGSSMMENNPGFTIGMIQDALITEAEKEAIFHGNAERLFGL